MGAWNVLNPGQYVHKLVMQGKRVLEANQRKKQGEINLQSTQLLHK